MFDQEMGDEEDVNKQLALLKELKEYAREGQSKELARSMGKQLPEDAPPEMSADDTGAGGPGSEDAIPGVEPETDEAGTGGVGGAGGDIDPELLKSILARLGQG